MRGASCLVHAAAIALIVMMLTWKSEHLSAVACPQGGRGAAECRSPGRSLADAARRGRDSIMWRMPSLTASTLASAS